MRTSSANRVGDEFARLSARGLDVASFFDETGRILRKAIAFDGFCSMTVDPATMLLTSHIAHDSVRPEDVPLLGRNEFLEEDVNKFAVLARTRPPAGVLTDATGHVPERSPRYRDILRPNGFGDELRFTLLDHDTCWGWVALYRGGESGDFRVEDAALAASFSQLLAEGLRRAILLAAVLSDDEPDAPGLILLEPDGTVEAMTPAAERWLGRLIAKTHAEGDLPAIVNSVAYRALLAARGGAPEGARTRVPTSVGTWVVIHGSVIGDPAEGRTAVIPRARTIAGDRAAHRRRLRAYGAGAPGDAARPPWSQHGRNRRAPARLGVHRPGSPEGDLRKGRRAQSARTRRGGLLPALRAAIAGGRADRRDRLVRRHRRNAVAVRRGRDDFG